MTGFKSFNDVHDVNFTLYLAKQQAGQQINVKWSRLMHISFFSFAHESASKCLCKQ